MIPPPQWVPRKKGYNVADMNVIIKSPIKQVVSGKQGIYNSINVASRKMTVPEFQRKANSDEYKAPKFFDYEDLEKKFWKNVTYIAPIYGADIPGTLTDNDQKYWNINCLPSILNYINTDYRKKIAGVNTAYLYFGMWKTLFSWHTEDMELYSINYLHFGAPKTWYAMPPQFGRKFEQFANSKFTDDHKNCNAYLRHKMTMISPQVLAANNIPFSKITQEPGEIMITFPFGYHAGFNHGFNCAESTNFATVRWIEYGKRATQCLCRPDMVKISMDTFVRRFQPERYENWLAGRDYGYHPEEPGKLSKAPRPTTLPQYRNSVQKRGCAALKNGRSRTKKVKDDGDDDHSYSKSIISDSSSEMTEIKPIILIPQVPQFSLRPPASTPPPQISPPQYPNPHQIYRPQISKPATATIPHAPIISLQTFLEKLNHDGQIKDSVLSTRLDSRQTIILSDED